MVDVTRPGRPPVDPDLSLDRRTLALVDLYREDLQSNTHAGLRYAAWFADLLGEWVAEGIDWQAVQAARAARGRTISWDDIKREAGL
jgi:hypothetical protein